MALQPGSVFAGEYKIVRLLDEGGMGAVYVAEQLSTGRQRALKIMHPHLARDAKLRARFEEEARLREVIDADIDQATDTPWLAMDLLEGEAPRQLLPSPSEKLDLAADIPVHGSGGARLALVGGLLLLAAAGVTIYSAGRSKTSAESTAPAMPPAEVSGLAVPLPTTPAPPSFVASGDIGYCDVVRPATSATALRAKGPVGNAQIGGAAVSGGSIANASSVVAGMAAGFRRCYNKGLQEDPKMKGSVRVTARIGPSGEVVSASPSGGGGLSGTVIACVAARVFSAQFAPPEGGSSTIVIPVTFVSE